MTKPMMMAPQCWHPYEVQWLIAGQVSLVVRGMHVAVCWKCSRYEKIPFSDIGPELLLISLPALASYPKLEQSHGKQQIHRTGPFFPDPVASATEKCGCCPAHKNISR